MNEPFDEMFLNALYSYRAKLDKLNLSPKNIIAYLGRREIKELQQDANFFSYGNINIEKNHIEYMGCEIIRVEKDEYFVFGIKDF